MIDTEDNKKIQLCFGRVYSNGRNRTACGKCVGMCVSVHIYS